MLRAILAVLCLLLIVRLVGLFPSAGSSHDLAGVAFIGFVLAVTLFFLGPPGEQTRTNEFSL